MGLVIYSNAGGDGDLFLAKPSLPCKSITAKEKDKAVHLTWEDPDSPPEDTTLYSEWASTRIVRKEGGFPVDENDGIVVVTSVTKNEYKDTPYVDTGLTNGTTYYYRAFTCSVDEVVNTTDNVQDSATPCSFQTMTVIIDLNDRNPATCGSYADNAIKMPSGKTKEAIIAWQDFFGYKPCLFKDGKVVGYLNPNDYTKFENGEPADITSGDAGDVMVEFPRRGLKISKTGKVITVTMTDNPDDPNFSYYAHSRGESRKEYFYLGAYLGCLVSNKLRSLSNQVPGGNTYCDAFRTAAHKQGTGYEQLTFYQWVFIQAMYCMQFCGNLNSQSALGMGYSKVSYHIKNGSLDLNGLIYGSTATTETVKLFGIESVYGCFASFVDGCTIKYGGIIGIATDNFSAEDTYTSYKSDDPPHHESGFLSDVEGSTELGFFPRAVNGSTSTYFSDYGSTYGLFYNGECTIEPAGDESTPYNINNYGIFMWNAGRGGVAAGDGFYARLSYY